MGGLSVRRGNLTTAAGTITPGQTVGNGQSWKATTDIASIDFGPWVAERKGAQRGIVRRAEVPIKPLSTVADTRGVS